jgi:hypothetical protein
MAVLDACLSVRAFCIGRDQAKEKLFQIVLTVVAA